MAKGTKVHSYPDLFLDNKKISIIIVAYDSKNGHPSYYGFEFIKEMNTQLESKNTVASHKKTLSDCKVRCEYAYERRLKEGWNSPFAEIAKQTEQKKLINFLDKYG